MGRIEEPLSSQDIGQFMGIRYRRYSGRFVGETAKGDYIVPYEITAPANPTEGNLRLIVEPPHFKDRLVVLRVLGQEFFFNRNFSHASVGFSTTEQRILNPTPGFQIIIGGLSYPPPPATPPAVTDLEIIADFATALRDNPPPLVGQLKRIYSIGLSDSGAAVHSLLHLPYGKSLFDLSVPGTTGFRNGHQPLEGDGLVMFFQSEFDFNVNSPPFSDRAYPNHRVYVVTGAPHIPDAKTTRSVPTPVSVAGTTPIDWIPFLKAIFVAGDRWCTANIEPPPSTRPLVAPYGGIARDSKGNGIGGLQHPALKLGEARFVASELRQPGNWRLFGAYYDIKSIGSPDFFPSIGPYLRVFERAVDDLGRAGFLLKEDQIDLINKARMRLPYTFTQNYQAGLFFPATGTKKQAAKKAAGQPPAKARRRARAQQA
ncbi:MAG TPA: alpha/beta hydrolase domain-containing protein [Pyrinomonadaceae bacterium]